MVFGISIVSLNALEVMGNQGEELRAMLGCHAGGVMSWQVYAVLRKLIWFGGALVCWCCNS